jgi:Beta-catenin-interacting protein ICAT
MSGSSSSSSETERLKANIQLQLSRLLLQLQDLEELRAELEDDEYLETKRDTLEQMEEFDAQLKKMMEGDLSLVSELGQYKLALRAAIADAVKEQDNKRAFKGREPAVLRQRLRTLQQDLKLGRVGEAAFRAQSLEAVGALKRLGEELTPEERAEMRRKFEGASADASVSETAVLAAAQKQQQKR